MVKCVVQSDSFKTGHQMTLLNYSVNNPDTQLILL